MIYKMYISRKCYYQFFKGGNRKLIKKKKDIKKMEYYNILKNFFETVSIIKRMPIDPFND